MDLIRMLLLIGLVLLVWRFPLHGGRPVREFLAWGVAHPLLFLLLVGGTLVLWGQVGNAYGLQLWFFHDNPLIQLLLGAAALMVVMGVDFCLLVLDTSQGRWADALRRTVSTLGSLSPARGDRPVLPGSPGNGLVERLTYDDLRKIARRYEIRTVEGWDFVPFTRWQAEELHEEVNSPRFRLLFAPAVLLVDSLMMVALLGALPVALEVISAWIVPLAVGASTRRLERLPWLLGAVSGAVAAITLARWASGSLSAAARREGADSLARIRTWAASFMVPEMYEAFPIQHEHPRRSRLGRSLPTFPTLLSFFTLLVAARQVPWLRERFEEASRVEAPWAQGVVWAVLIVAAVLAYTAGGAWDRFIGRNIDRALDFVLTPLLRRSRLVLGVAMALLTGLAVSSALWDHDLSVPQWQARLLEALGALAMLLVLVVALLLCILLATGAGVGIGRRWAVAAAVGCLVGLALLQWDEVRPSTLVTALPALLIGTSLLIAPEDVAGRPTPAVAPPWLRRVREGVGRVRVSRFSAGLAALGAALLAAILWTQGPEGRAVTAYHSWQMLAMLALSAVALAAVARGVRVHALRPEMVFPLSAIAAYFAFAVFFNGLGESARAALPSGASLLIIGGLLAIGSVVASSLSPSRPAIAAITILGIVCLLNGSAWLRPQNAFKLTFPGLDRYYDLPVYLNSEAYFRETTPGLVKLGAPAQIESGDRGRSLGMNQRLATAEVLPANAGSGSERTLTFRDRRGRLRARKGDHVRLMLPETIVRVRREGRQLRLDFEQDEGLEALYRSCDQARLEPIYGGDNFGARRSGYDLTLDPHRRSEPRLIPASPASGLILTTIPEEWSKPEVERIAIAASWSGTVVGLHEGGRVLDVQLKKHPFLKELAMTAIRSKLDAGLLYLERAQWPLDDDALARGWLPEVDRAPPGEDPRIRVGDSLSVVDVRGETPVVVADFLHDPKSRLKFERSLVATADNVRDAVSAARPRRPALAAAGGTVPAPFVLRADHNRGAFRLASIKVETLDNRKLFVWIADLGNADRLHIPPDSSAEGPQSNDSVNWKRQPDRLVLRWTVRGEGGREEARSGLFRVMSLGEAEPGTESSIRRGVRLERIDAHEEVPDPARIAGRWQICGLLENREVLDAWKVRAGHGWPAGKPPLVIVTVSGGGIRSSAWTAHALARLESELGAFPDHIRLITGASGGMVGASYYATTLSRQPAPGMPHHSVPLEDIGLRVSRDQLSAVAGRLAFADIPGMLNPFRQNGDRGRVLESTWKQLTGGEGSPLARPFRDYAADEALGLRPSLIFTPMLVEDGRRMLISNLDLGFVTRNIGGMLLEARTRKIGHLPAIDDRGLRGGDDLMSLSAVEFFRLFPDAWGFETATAARMSATFPLASPAVSLPTVPPRRVVDAGYYDNYGVNLSALWLAELRDWIVANTSGVVLVQIRDHVSQSARTEIEADELARGSSSPIASLVNALTFSAVSNLLETGSQPLTSPLHGVSAAREWTMSFRNDEQVELLDELFDDQEEHDSKLIRPFFTSVVFECPVEASLSWTLSERERRILANGFGEGAKPDAGDDYLDEPPTAQGTRKASLGNPTTDEALYSELLARLGFDRGDLPPPDQAAALYKNVMNNRKRLGQLKLWWEQRRVAH